MTIQVPGQLTIRGAELLPGRFRNFSGRTTDFASNKREFSVKLEPDLAMAMLQDGWPVKQLKEREPGTPGDYFITAQVKYRSRKGEPLKPPRVVLITSLGRLELTEQEVEVIDFADIKHVDLILRPYHYDMTKSGGSEGINAYLKSIFVTLNEDELDQEYNKIPEIQASSSASPLLQIEAGASANQEPGEDEDDSEEGMDIVEAELVD